MKQEVINYQFQILQNQLIQKNQSRSQTLTDVYRYSPWKLNDTLKQILVQKSNYELKWIGNCENSYIIAYFYSIMQICSGKPSVMVKLKHSLYKVCQYCLNLSEQRTLVEFLNILQEQNAIGGYMKSNRNTQDLLVKIYESSLNIAKIDPSNPESDHFQKLKLYTKRIFPFISILSPLGVQEALQIRLDDHEPIYILRQKQCYFILDFIVVNNHPRPLVVEKIDEEVEEDTVVIQNDKLSEKSKTDSQATSKEKNVKKVPKFLHSSNLTKDKELASQKQRYKGETSNNSKTEQKGKITLPTKQIFANKIITNFKTTVNKSEERQPHTTKSIKKVSPEVVQNKSPTLASQRKKISYQPKSHLYQPSTKVTDPDIALSKVNSQQKIPSSFPYTQIKDETLRHSEDRSMQNAKKKFINKSISQKEKITIHGQNKTPEVSQPDPSQTQANVRGKISPRFSNKAPFVMYPNQQK